MSTENSRQPKSTQRLTIANCEICSLLRDTETSFYKYGWDDGNWSLPSAAARLVSADPAATTDGSRADYIKMCPLCGIFYHYILDYEYLVNGSEDDETLTRLTPAEARQFLNNDAYQKRMVAAFEDLQSSHPLTRNFAVQCVVAHYISQNQAAEVRPFLSNSDPEILRSTLRGLRQAGEDAASWSNKLRPLEDLLRLLADHQEAGISGVARYLIRTITQ